MAVYSFVCWGLFSGGEDEVEEVGEHPVIFEGVVDDSEELAGQSCCVRMHASVDH